MKQAFETIVQILLNRHKYPLQLENDNRWIKHPFREQDYWVEFVGGLGVSDSISPFIYWILTEDLEKLIIWSEAQHHKERFIGNDIYAEAVTVHNTSYLCSGMTDYSGEGGSAYKMLKKVFEFLSEVYSLEIEVKKVEHNTLEKQLRELENELPNV